MGGRGGARKEKGETVRKKNTKDGFWRGNESKGRKEESTMEGRGELERGKKG